MHNLHFTVYSPSVNVRKHGNMSMLVSEVHELLLYDSLLNSTDLVLNALKCEHNNNSD